MTSDSDKTDKDTQLKLVVAIFFSIISSTILEGSLTMSYTVNRLENIYLPELKTYQPVSDQPAKKIRLVETMQRELQCCGLTDGPQEWTKIPDSCKCSVSSTNLNNCRGGVYKSPCYNVIYRLTVLKKKKLIKYSTNFSILLDVVVCCLMVFKDIHSPSSHTRTK